MLLLDSPVLVKASPIALLRGRDVPHPERDVARGTLTRIRHGVYASTTLWDALPPWDRYLARVHAAALAYPEAVFCLESAAALQGGPTFGDPLQVHVLVPSTATARLYAGVRTHRSRPERGIALAGGLAMTSLADTAIDLARHRHNAIGLAAADAALRLDSTVSADDLVRANEQRASSRGRRLARWPLSRATPLAETAFESVSRAVIEWLGFPQPDLQVTFRFSTGAEDRSDFFWHDLDIVGEADGDMKYDGRFGDARTVLRRQHDRDRRLRTRVRALTHWGWFDMAKVAPLRSILTGVGLRAVAPEDPAPLQSLMRVLASRAPHRTG